MDRCSCIFISVICALGDFEQTVLIKLSSTWLSAPGGADAVGSTEFQRLSTEILEESLPLSRHLSLDIQKKRKPHTIPRNCMSIGFSSYTSAEPCAEAKNVTQLFHHSIKLLQPKGNFKILFHFTTRWQRRLWIDRMECAHHRPAMNHEQRPQTTLSVHEWHV